MKFHYIQFEETYTLYEMRIPEIDTSWFIVLLYSSSLMLVYFRGYPSYREELNQSTYAGEPTQTEPTGAESLLKEPFEVFRDGGGVEQRDKGANVERPPLPVLLFQSWEGEPNPEPSCFDSDEELAGCETAIWSPCTCLTI